MNPRPYALLAEITYACPLHCPYCSNPTESNGADTELSTDEWRRVIAEAATLGVLQIGFSGGEPLVRRDLGKLIETARGVNLYTNLITSGVGFNAARARELRDAGLDSLQLSFQADVAELGDRIAGARAHQEKIRAAQLARDIGIALSLNFVVHRANIDRLAEMIEFGESLGAMRVELANTQYYGWGFLNRAQLLPTRDQVERAHEVAAAAKSRLEGTMEVFYVLPDYYMTRPKPCMSGWGQRYITVNPIGKALPCPTASSAIPTLKFENVRKRSLGWIWNESESFNCFRGTQWMREPCSSCPYREEDFGGCRCQAALITGDPRNTDPVCAFSPNRGQIDAMLSRANLSVTKESSWVPRTNPQPRALGST